MILRIKTLLYTFTMVILLLSSCGGTTSSEGCEYCGKTPTKAFKNNVVDDVQYYCKDHYSICSKCDKKATKKYVNLLGYYVFVCAEHYKEAVSED